MISSFIELAKLAIAYEKAVKVYFPGLAKEIGVLASAVLAEEGIRYWMAPGGTSITCTGCRITSNNPDDVHHRYCPACHVFHEQARVATVPPQAKTEDA